MPIVISTRRLEPLYNVETFIRAMPLILRRAPATFFVIVGSGSQETMLRALAEKLNVDTRITWLGTVPNDKLPQVLHDADVYVSTSLSDGGLAISTCEAMACGLPVVITDVCDNKNWLIGGFMFPPRNHEQLAEHVIFLLFHPHTCTVLGEENRRLILEGNNLATQIAKLERLYSNKIG